MSDTNTLLARRVFDQLLADPDRRRRACELFHGAATVAAETADESWTLTVPRDGRRIHLNVGRFLAVGVARDGVSLILDVSGPDLPEAIAVERSTSGRDWVAKALDDIVIRDFTLDHIEAHWSEIEPLHRAAVERAAGSAKRANTHWAHSPDAVAIAEDAIGRKFPENTFPGRERSSALVDGARSRFEQLYAEFAETWADTADAAAHTAEIHESRRTARENYEALKAAVARGDDITERALLHLLPHADSEKNRARGAWISIAPAVAGDVRDNFEGAGWTRPEDWPAVARALWDFVRTCVEDPDELEAACDTFAANPVTKGMKSDMVTPILNALAPEHFLTVNKKSRGVISVLHGFDFDTGLEDYPACNAAGFAIVDALDDVLTVPSEMSQADRFDTFCHWLVAERKLDLAELGRGIAPSGKREPRAGRTSPTPDPSVAFTPKTFELLERLHEAPRKDTYLDAKAEFQQHVERPLQDLFRRVRDRLPEHIRSTVESEKGVFSKFLKNDFGRGGAWDFYWGAFYPKGGKRVSDPQLFLWLNHEVLDAGFYIGMHGTDKRKRFLRNVRTQRELLRDVLEDVRKDPRLTFGARDVQSFEGAADFDTWLADPATPGIRVGAYLRRDTLLSTGIDEIAQTIAARFEALWPLFLCTLDVNAEAELTKLRGEDDDDTVTPNPPFSLADVAGVTHLPVDDLARWTRAIGRKRQAVFYGPPGTGKTFVAKALARHLVAGGRGEIDLVQFHPSYAYEDFMQGIRPETTPDGQVTYEMVRGRFLEFCDRARTLPEDELNVLIVDEINRANLSRVFGELMYLLEYRTDSVELAGGGSFSIPSNVRILGTMNTADRSIALVDHALRRRFAFIELRPSYDVLTRFHGDAPLARRMAEILAELNRTIGDPNYEVGVSFFLNPQLEHELEDIWRMEIEPYLGEFFFNQPDKVDKYRWERIRERLES